MSGMGSPYAWAQERVNQYRLGGNRDTSAGSGDDGHLTALPFDSSFLACYSPLITTLIRPIWPDYPRCGGKWPKSNAAWQNWKNDLNAVGPVLHEYKLRQRPA